MKSLIAVGTLTLLLLVNLADRNELHSTIAIVSFAEKKMVDPSAIVNTAVKDAVIKGNLLRVMGRLSHSMADYNGKERHPI